jgi:YVTN family beta-propeller protein
VAIGALALALAAPAAASAAPEAPAATATITVGSEPFGVAVNPVTGTAYVANTFRNTVSVISGRTRTVTDTITVGSGPVGVGVNPVTGMVYVANNSSGTVSVISRWHRAWTAHWEDANRESLGSYRTLQPWTTLYAGNHPAQITIMGSFRR